MRLDKALALSGMTRSEAKKCIAAGRVWVNGKPERDAGAHVEIFEVAVDGRPLNASEALYIMLHKPAGVVTATEDGRFPTVIDLLPEALRRRKLGPVGRLDRDVTGLVLLTNDGVLAHRLTSPRWKAEKAYLARCEGTLNEDDIQTFAAGVALNDGAALPAKLEILSTGAEETIARVTLTEGRFHQVKRMFAAIGHPLSSLRRERIGCVWLDDALQEGQWRYLTEKEISGLKQMTDMEE
ncbi:MAG: rRNA pseudouridine synthase [Clostridia bacterium]|nr:rRNA pseudouridine synthase [Clostridia bacterium]